MGVLVRGHKRRPQLNPQCIWSIGYTLEHSSDEYLRWFHEVHIPDKLSRPGYAWAAHYESIEQPGRYLALFGALSARVFLCPTPGQLKGRQDALTRRMTGMRVGASSSVLMEVLALDRRDATRPAAGPVLRFAQVQAADAAAEDDFCAWATADRLPQLAALPRVLHAALLVGILGQPRHALIEHYESRDAVVECTRTSRALTARRIWPAT